LSLTCYSLSARLYYLCVEPVHIWSNDCLRSNFVVMEFKIKHWL
jgi:hypothetical protein